MIGEPNLAPTFINSITTFSIPLNHEGQYTVEVEDKEMDLISAWIEADSTTLQFVTMKEYIITISPS